MTTEIIADFLRETPLKGAARRKSSGPFKEVQI